jgi:branched-chain amino acid transport system substrate-binding protein
VAGATHGEAIVTTTTSFSNLPKVALSLLLGVALLTACSPPKPVRIGFIGGLSDRTSDTGEAGRNGLMLAVEQRNKAGGLKGRQIEIVVQDDGQKPEQAKAAIKFLIDAKVDVVVGPYTSAMAAAALPFINEARMTMVSPVASSLDFLGLDDYFIRVNRTTRDNARDYARQIYQRGQRQVAVAYDTRNRSFSTSWLQEFKLAFAAQGGALSAEVPFESQPDLGYIDVAQQMLASKPDGVVFIASAIDVARLAQQLTKLAPDMPKSAAEWAATESLLELGGKSVEGLLIAQSHNRNDTSERFQGFRKAYFDRFGREPGFSSVASFDAALILFQALERQSGDESLKDAVLKYGPYPGLHQPINFDKFGDTPRPVFFTEIRAGQFVPVK